MRLVTEPIISVNLPVEATGTHTPEQIGLHRHGPKWHMPGSPASSLL